MACDSMYQKVQYVQLTLFPPVHFDLVITCKEGVGGGGGVWKGGVKLFPSYSFLDRELLFIDVKLGTYISIK